jgi:tRNA 5-methylaminomethyl-2-thiouridine biosynthesis bifunctional protein
VIGAGLAGAAAAASMARRGWTVHVLDAARSPASGASGLPAGVLVPHSSPDDNLLSRLSRDGVRATLQQAQALLVPGEDFDVSGVLEHHVDGIAHRSASHPDDAAAVWNRPADASQKELAGLDACVAADWHEKAAWIRPARLVQAWLAQPGVQLQCEAKVASLDRVDGQWQALGADGAVLARGTLVVLAAAVASQELLPGLALQAVRGQVTWALHGQPLQLPPFPVNGDGSFIPSVPTAQGPAWICGASFDRGDSDLAARPGDQQANLSRLRRLLPGVAGQFAAGEASNALQAWTGVRCASTDRRPLVGPLDPEHPDGVWLSTAMGSRGLTFAALCGELIAAQVHGEPLPLARNLARALSAARHRKAAAGRASAGE